MSPPLCPFCRETFDAGAFLRRVSGYSTATDSGSSSCPACGHDLEFRVDAGALTLGYTYWAGSLHFEGMDRFPVRGLRQVRRDGSISFELGGTVFPVPGTPPEPAR